MCLSVSLSVSQCVLMYIFVCAKLLELIFASTTVCVPMCMWMSMFVCICLLMFDSPPSFSSLNMGCHSQQPLWVSWPTNLCQLTSAQTLSSCLLWVTLWCQSWSLTSLTHSQHHPKWKHTKHSPWNQRRTHWWLPNNRVSASALKTYIQANSI